MSPPVLTAEHLARWGACEPEAARFAACYPHGLLVTVENAELALAEGFYVLWLAEVFHPSALVEYERMTARARAEYERVRTQALAKYQWAKASAWAEWVAVAVPSWTGYRAAQALAWTEYERTVVTALVPAMVSCWDEIGGEK